MEMPFVKEKVKCHPNDLARMRRSREKDAGREPVRQGTARAGKLRWARRNGSAPEQSDSHIQAPGDKAFLP